MGRIYNNIVETVGRTPLVRLNKVTAGVDATILLKCEYFNPLGSVKDRIGMAGFGEGEKGGGLEKTRMGCLLLRTRKSAVCSRRTRPSSNLRAATRASRWRSSRRRRATKLF